MRDWSRYVGIPFVDMGRGFDGCDCYGLVRLALLHEYGKALPLLTGEYNDVQDHEKIASIVGQWAPLLAGERQSSPMEADVVVINVSGAEAHVGLYVGSGMILHAWKRATGSVLHRSDHAFFRGRIEGYYRVL